MYMTDLHPLMSVIFVVLLGIIFLFCESLFG